MRSDESFEVGMGLVRAYILLQLYADGVVPQFGIETYELHLMFRLRQGAPMTQAELGRAIARDPMSVSRLVRGLESRGLVRRTASAQDARARMVALTPRGAELASDVVAALDAGNPLNGMSRRDVQMFGALLQRATTSLREACMRVGISPERQDNPAIDKPRRRRHGDARGNDAAASRGRVVRPEPEEPLPRAAKRR